MTSYPWRSERAYKFGQFLGVVFFIYACIRWG
jgi:hypothetical protein